MKQLIFTILSFFLCQFTFAQNQTGLHVEHNYSVLFGQDLTSDGLKTLWLPSKGAFRSGNMTPAWDYSAIGNVSSAFGSYTQASGNYSFATGLGTTANSFAEFSIGQYSLTGGGVNAWVAGTDPVFEIGNGLSSSAKSNMLTVQKSGNVKIGNMTDASEVIQEKLVVDGGIVVGENIDQSPSEGTIIWTGSDFKGWDGKKWVSFTGKSTVTDIDGNIYETVRIGNQDWMIENLKVTKYNDGSVISHVTTASTWSTQSTGAWSWYNNNSSYDATYGKLYNWFVVGTDKLCPIGWHVPDKAEWDALINFLGGQAIAGGKAKEMGYAHWNAPNIGATNESCFTGFPGGIRNQDGTFGAIGTVGLWWSRKNHIIDYSDSYSLGTNSSIFSDNITHTKTGRSIRCVSN